MKLRRISLLLLSFVTIISSLTPLLGGAASAAVAGETFTWSSFTSINLTGGEFIGTNKLSGTGVAVPGYPETFTNGGVNHNSGCYFSLTIRLRSNQTGELLGLKSAGTAPPGSPSTKACEEDVYGKYNNVLVNIVGTRPTENPDSETQAEKAATFKLTIPYTGADQKDDQHFVSITGNGNNQRVRLIYLGTAAGESSGEDSEIYFSGVAYLEPGNYSCTITGYSCPAFEKVKHTPYTYSVVNTDGIIVTLQTSIINAAGMVVLPATKVSLQKADGTELKSFTTTEKSVKASDMGGKTELSDVVVLDQIPAGSYKLCLPDNRCQNITKVSGQVLSVTLDVNAEGDGGEGGGSTEGEGCESQPNVVMGWLTCPIINVIDGATDFLDNQIISLLVVPESYYANKDPETGENSALYQTWQRLRNIAVIILVPILLFMVISTALGFDFIDAYTIKKSLPRFVIAVIFITLSWWIVTFLIDTTNTVGKGILGIMTAPFGGANGISLRSLYDPTLLEGAGSAVAAGGAAFVFTAMLFAGGSIGVIFSFGFSTLLGLLVAFLVLATRQMLVVALMLFAPLAILSWIFPGNDKLWKLWWQTFSKLLIMFPMIMVLIGAGRIFAAVIDQAGSDTLINTLLKLIAYVAPYFFIPATFKLAGSLFATITGVVNNKSKGLFDRQKKYRSQATGKAWERTGSRRVLQARAGTSRRLTARASRSGKLGAFLARGGAGIVGGYNVEAVASEKQAHVSKELNDQIATGRDEAIRGLTVDKAAAKDSGALVITKRNSSGVVTERSNGLMRETYNDDGSLKAREYKSLGGAWISEAYVDEGHSRWGKDHFAQQTALSYEMRKAMTEEQVAGIGQRYRTLAKGTWGMTDTEAGGAWIGSAFENQNQHIEFKNMSWEDGSLSGNGTKMVDELYEKKGSYQLSQMSSHTIVQLQRAYRMAEEAGDEDTMSKIKSITETFVHDVGLGAPGGVAGMEGKGDAAVPITGPMLEPTVAGVPAEPGTPRPRMASTPGPGHVAERVRELAEMTRVIYTAPSGEYPVEHEVNSPIGGPAGAETNRREQKL